MKSINYIHGQCHPTTKEYRAWSHIKTRCYNKKVRDYPRYGGRGITMCDKWRNSFLAFFQDIGKAPSPEYTIERIDNSKGYEPDNVRWATRYEQAMNRRRSRKLTYKGKTKHICEWEIETGINHQTIQMRIDFRGWSVEKALSTPTPKQMRQIFI